MPKPAKPLTRPCRLEAGRLYWSDGTERHERTQRKLLAAAMKHLPDGPYEFELRPWAETRRAKQNAYLWAVIYKLIAQESGYTVDQVHELMKVRHNNLRMVDPETGEEIRVGQTTTKLSIADFAAYIDAVMLDGAEWWGITFPEPRQSEDWRDGRNGRAA